MTRIEHRRWWCGVVLAAMLFVPAIRVQAANQCFPTATGVPAQGGPPKWWGGNTSTLDDPRWKGAFAVGYAGAVAEFKALSTNEAGRDYALLMFHVKADPSPPADTDFVFFGFSDGAGKAYAFRLTRTESSTAEQGQTVTSANMSGISFNGTSWSAMASLPGWLTSDTNVTVVSCGGSPAACDYAFRVRVPFDPAGTNINTGINLPVGGFKFWYEMRAVADGTVAKYKWLETATDAVQGGAPLMFQSAPSPTDANSWASFKLGDATCAGGVRLAPEFIKVTYPGSTSDTEISPKQGNTFHVQPINESSGSLAHSTIQARLRIADFGSSMLWHDVSTGSTCNAAVDGASGAVMPPAGTFDLTCTWTLTHSEACEYRPDVETGCPAGSSVKAHQCILANLSVSPGAGVTVTFSVDSAYRNMDFGTASWFQRYATVDLAEAKLPAGATNDVYLYVKTLNMPEASQQLGVGGEHRYEGRDAKSVERLRSQLALGQITFDTVEKVMPTYTVYVWYDTGEKLTQGSHTYRVVAPRPSFGYFLSHEGKPERWGHRIECDHTLTKVLPDFYRFSLRRKEAATVWTAVNASDPGITDVEPVPTFPPLASTGESPRWWIFALVLALVVLGLIVRWLVTRK